MAPLASHVHVAAPRREPTVAVPAEELRKLGVLSWKLDADAFEADTKLEAIRNVRGYSYQVQCCDPLPPMIPPAETALTSAGGLHDVTCAGSKVMSQFSSHLF
jgi:hypothetical protein